MAARRGNTDSVLFVMLLWTGVALSNIPFEAAFQGKCDKRSPCEHHCIDLKDGTFECSCEDGYMLAHNGYSCLQIPTTSPLTPSKGRTMPGMPPHPGFSGISKFNQQNKNSKKYFDDDDQMMQDAPDISNGDVFQGYDFDDDDYDSDDSEGIVILSHVDVNENDVPKPTMQSQTHSDLVDPTTTATKEATQKLLAMTSTPPTTLQVKATKDPKHNSCAKVVCYGGGTCLQSSHHRVVRCQCPIGLEGEFCEKELDLMYPKFYGHSYLAFPVLKHAYKDMQVTIEFRPEVDDGLLLYSGERKDLKGDFVSIILVNGYVELRFDCGSGIGLIRSLERVKLNQWNKLLFFRHRWDAWLHLNDGKQIQGRAQGLYARITFRENLFLGGCANNSLVAARTGTKKNFIGCVKYFEINGHKYDMRPAPRGDIIYGVDVGECSSHVCSKLRCKNGGKCHVITPDTAICLCPLGLVGELCDKTVEIQVPSFNGSSYLRHKGLGNTMLSFLEMEIIFKPYERNGAIFYNGYKTDKTGDFISLNLIDGFLDFRFDLGTGPAIIRSHKPVTMNEWHVVQLSRTGRDGIMEIDQQLKSEGLSGGAFTQLSLPLDMFIGGVRSLDEVAKHSNIRSSFKGCIQKVVINGKPVNLVYEAMSGVNVDNCQHPCVGRPCLNGGYCTPKHDFYICNCKLGFTNTNCETEIKEPITIPMFQGNSFMHYTESRIMKRINGNKLDFNLKFRAFSPDGLIAWSGQKEMTTSSDFLAIGLKGGLLHFRYNLGSGEVVITQNSSRVDDGKWHRIRIIRTGREGSLRVDNELPVSAESPGTLQQLNVDNGLFIGGMENMAHLTLKKYTSGLVGCLSNVTLSTDYHIKLVKEANQGMNINQCV